MPLLGGLLVSLFSGLVGWFAQYVTRKVAFAAAALTAYTSLTVGLFVVLRSTVIALHAIVTGVPAIFLDVLQMGIPPVAAPCLSAYVTIWTACTVYVWQRDLLKLAAAA